MSYLFVIINISITMRIGIAMQKIEISREEQIMCTGIVYLINLLCYKKLMPTLANYIINKVLIINSPGEIQCQAILGPIL